MYKRLIVIVLMIITIAGMGWRPFMYDETSKFEGDTQKSVNDFLSLLSTAEQKAKLAQIESIREGWQDQYAMMALETAYLSNDNEVAFRLIELLQEHTGQRFGYDFNEWYQWFWNREEHIPADYGEFKAGLYKLIDPKFATYFEGRTDQTKIRLDEVRWGGVRQDGIPPLRQPRMIQAGEADYLEEDHVVFGIEVNGDFRAYPKRILAWHEMFVDEVGGIPVAGVYCTLCGTMVLYKTEWNGVNHQLGTSGFLYRSNKLMYDQATQSLWSTLLGEPVIGPLIDKSIALEHLSVVTTTWGEWKKRHPETTVLSVNTGYARDYGEGVAYRDYFATDELMFNVPNLDKRLKNKQEVLALRFPEAPGESLAISTRFLEKNTIYQNQLGGVEFVVLTDKSGANRVYERNNVKFVQYAGEGQVTDGTGKKWTVTESALINESGHQLARLPYHRAFWFGWQSAYPETRLVK